MIPLQITLDSQRGITVLSNIFIDQYMKDANDAQIKIYLYLLRMVGANLPTDIAEIADKFNHTEKDVIRSLSYWEQMNLLTLRYDEKHNIVGIHLLDMVKGESCVTKKSAPELTLSQEIPMISMDYAKEKEKYSLEDLKALQSNPEVKMLLNATSQYFGRPLNPIDIKTVLFIYDRLAFSLDLTDYLIDYCVDHGQTNIHYIEKVAINWYEEGIDTPAKAKQLTKKADKSAYTIMKYLGKTGEPTVQELEYIRKWLNTYGFSLSIIEDACNRTVLATDKNRFPYADSILKNWFANNVHTKKDILLLDEEYETRKSSKIKPVAAPKGNSQNSSFCRIEQHDYDFEALERALTK